MKMSDQVLTRLRPIRTLPALIISPVSAPLTNPVLTCLLCISNPPSGLYQCFGASQCFGAHQCFGAYQFPSGCSLPCPLTPLQTQVATGGLASEMHQRSNTQRAHARTHATTNTTQRRNVTKPCPTHCPHQASTNTTPAHPCQMVQHQPRLTTADHPRIVNQRSKYQPHRHRGTVICILAPHTQVSKHPPPTSPTSNSHFTHQRTRIPPCAHASQQNETLTSTPHIPPLRGTLQCSHMPRKTHPNN
jgi:hypothetical protein